MAQGAINAGYAGIPSLLYHPEVRPNLIARYKDDDFLDFLDQAGKWRKKGDSQFYTAYDTPLYVNVSTTGSVVTGSGTATVTVTGLNAANANILIVGHLVRFPNGLQGRVMTVSTTTLTNDTVVIKSSAAANPVLTLVTGNTLIQYSNAQEEGSLEPAPERWGYDTFYNLIEVFRKAGEVTDIAKARFSSGNFALNVGGQETVVSWNAVRTLMSHRSDIANGLLYNEMSDANFTATSPTLVGARGYGVQVTRGLLPSIRDFGWTANLATPGTILLSDLDAINAAITAARGAKEYLIVGANAVITKISGFLKGLATGGVASVRMNITGRKVDLMVEQYIHGGVTFNLMALNSFDNQQVMPTTDAFAKTAYFIPMGSASTYGPTGNSTGMADYLSVGYMGINGSGSGTEKQAELHLGALATPPTDGTNSERWVYATACGLDIVMPYIFGDSRILA